MDVLAKILADFEARSTTGRGSLEVPEWGCTVYWRPITLEDRRVIQMGPESAGDQVVSVIMHRLEHEDGTRVFDGSVTTRAKLMKSADATIFDRIFAAMAAPTDLAAAKNG